MVSGLPGFPDIVSGLPGFPRQARIGGTKELFLLAQDFLFDLAGFKA